MKLRKILCLIMAVTVSCGAFSALPAGAVDVISDIASEASIEEVYFDWDKSSDEGISFDTGSLSKNVVLKRNGIIVASSLLSRNLSINDGQVSIGAGILGKFSEGEHTFSVILSDGIFDLTVNITDNEREITAEKTDFEWDRSSLLGITVNTDSKSKKVVVLKDDMIISEGLLDAGIILGKVTISKNVLGKLDDGENKLQLVLDDGLIDVNVNVTNENAEKYVTAKTDYFEWDKSNILGISVDTNSRSKNINLYKDNEFISENDGLNLYILLGKIGISSKILKTLDVGENVLTLSLDDGTIDILVNVTDKKNAPKEITADNTVFEWDKSNILGISVKTNSESKNVSLYKDDELISENDKLNLYILLGKVGISSKILKTLDIGENKLTLKLDDGEIDITVNVTDKKNEVQEEISAEKTFFTWQRNSLSGIEVVTNSKSKTVAIRQNNRLFAESDGQKLSISDGRINISADLLSRLDDGRNTLTLKLEDGETDIIVNVVNSAVSGTKNNSNINTSSYSSNSYTGFNTGDNMDFISLIVSLAGISLMCAFLLMRKNRAEK